ncbi:hypothetical protein [Actinacidiphila glaucinigra]|uniref:hypothetical protein n=1 Tax=Actinacidiphila glaucinigra TaxID=235986 RepID=UPI0035D61346
MGMPSSETIAATLAQRFVFTRRVPVLRRPDDYGLAYEDVAFPEDGTPVEGWFIPADSDKLVIANHPMPCNRYGYPGHLPEYATPIADFEINFLPDYRHLHDAGFNGPAQPRPQRRRQRRPGRHRPV